MSALISDKFSAWQAECEARFQQLKANEEELNRIFIDIYGLQDELTPEVADKDVTVHRIFRTKDDVPESMKGSAYVRTLRDEIVSLLSYAVGCMFGRYSLDAEGLAYAGGDFSEQWAVVSGQYYKREAVEYYVGKELQRALGMAESDAVDGGNVSAGKAAAAGRVVRFVRPDAQSGGVDPLQYRRGTSAKFYEGICKLSLDCTGLDGGAGNTAYDLCSPEILAAITNGSGAELVQRGWKDAERLDWKAVRCALTTDRFCPDADNCIPVTDEEYFPDDVVGRLVEFVRVVYGADTLEENLDFIAGALGNKGATSREVIRNYFLNDFIKDHNKTYQKRPIYWMFDSGKMNGFKALVYMHRWNADTTGNVRVEYLHRIQRVYESEISRMQDVIDNSPNAREASAAQKRKDKLAKQLKETRDYDAKIAHLALARIGIDLDDGVKVNYEKVQTGPDGKKLAILTALK